MINRTTCFCLIASYNIGIILSSYGDLSSVFDDAVRTSFPNGTASGKQEFLVALDQREEF